MIYYNENDKYAAETIRRLSGLMCLVCGRPTPCTETPEACTFDPNPIEAAQEFQRRAHAAEAKAAALEAELKVAREDLLQWLLAISGGRRASIGSLDNAYCPQFSRGRVDNAIRALTGAKP